MEESIFEERIELFSLIFLLRFVGLIYLFYYFFSGRIGEEKGRLGVRIGDGVFGLGLMGMRGRI